MSKKLMRGLTAECYRTQEINAIRLEEGKDYKLLNGLIRTAKRERMCGAVWFKLGQVWYNADGKYNSQENNPSFQAHVKCEVIWEDGEYKEVLNAEHITTNILDFDICRALINSRREILGVRVLHSIHHGG